MAEIRLKGLLSRMIVIIDETGEFTYTQQIYEEEHQLSRIFH